MLSVQHGHYRPDMVERTGVIEPWDIQRYSPVDVAQHTVDPFIDGVRQPGPSVAPQPSAEAIANAAAAVAQSWDAGKAAAVHVGAFRVKVTPDMPAPGGIVGQVVAAARALREGRTIVVRSPGSDSVIMQGRPQSQVVATAPGVAVKATPGPTANIAPGGSAPNNPNVAVTASYPSTYDDLTKDSTQLPMQAPGPFVPQYTPTLLDRRTQPNWPAAGRNSIQRNADAYGNQQPSVVDAARSQVATLYKAGV